MTPEALRVPRQVRGIRVGLAAYVSLVVALWGASMALELWTPIGLSAYADWNWPLLAALLIGIAVLERQQTDLFGGSQISLSAVGSFVAAILVDPGPAGLVIFAGVLLGPSIPRVRRPWYKRLGNGTPCSQRTEARPRRAPAHAIAYLPAAVAPDDDSRPRRQGRHGVVARLAGAARARADHDEPTVRPARDREALADDLVSDLLMPGFAYGHA